VRASACPSTPGGCRSLKRLQPRTGAPDQQKRTTHFWNFLVSTMKHTKTNSVEEAVRAVRSPPVSPPSNVPLADGDIQFFANVVDEFARAEWTAHRIELAAMLARSMADLAREQNRVRDEGFVTVRENGTMVVNPRARVCRGLVGEILALRRSLSLHARARAQGDSRNIAKRNEILKDQEFVDFDDDLLARWRKGN